MNTPEKPIGVEVRCANGEYRDVALRYVGYDADGFHAWETVEVFDPADAVGMKLATLPANAALRVRVTRPVRNLQISPERARHRCAVRVVPWWRWLLGPWR